MKRERLLDKITLEELIELKKQMTVKRSRPCTDVR